MRRPYFGGFSAFKYDLVVDLAQLLLDAFHLRPYLFDRSVVPGRLSQLSAAFQNLHGEFDALVF
jgi:hypothetical protein